MRFILRLSINAIIILGVSYLVPGFGVSSFVTAFIFALILGVVNAVLRPLLNLLSLPLTILTLGLFALVINAFTFWLASVVSFGIYVDGFGAAFWAALIVWIGSVLTGALLKDADE